MGTESLTGTGVTHLQVDRNPEVQADGDGSHWEYRKWLHLGSSDTWALLDAPGCQAVEIPTGGWTNTINEHQKAELAVSVKEEADLADLTKNQEVRQEVQAGRHKAEPGKHKMGPEPVVSGKLEAKQEPAPSGKLAVSGSRC